MQRSFIIWLAAKQVFTKNRKAGLSFMTVASILGVALGVAALVITLSVMGGFEKDLRSKMFRGLPHMEIYHENPSVGISLSKTPLSEFKNEFSDVTHVEPFVKSDIVMKHGRHISSVTMFGVDHVSKGSLWGFEKGVVYGQMEKVFSDDYPPSLILGDDLAIQLGVDVGDEIEALSPSADLSGALSGQKMSQTYKIAGVFSTGLSQLDSKYAVTSVSQARKFMADYDVILDDLNYVTGIALNLGDPDDVDLFVNLGKDFSNYVVSTWKEVNKSLLFALKLEKYTMSALLFLIVLVAAFSISGTIMMTVYYKKQQISLLRALGMEFDGIVRLFLSHGVVIGVVGLVLGLSVGLGVCFFIAEVGTIRLPAGVYVLKSLPVRFLYFEYVMIALGALLLTLAASIYPAVLAAKQDPGQGLRG